LTAQIVAARFIALMFRRTVPTQALRNKLRRYGTCEISSRCLSAAQIVAARFIALMLSCTVSIRALRINGAATVRAKYHLGACRPLRYVRNIISVPVDRTDCSGAIYRADVELHRAHSCIAQ